MFTGIIEATAEVLKSSGASLVIGRPAAFDDIAPGHSIAVSGVCLTVTSADASTTSFDVVSETMDRSTLGTLRKGSRVNLERAVAVGERLHGHIVQGHCEGVGTVIDISDASRMRVRVPKDLLPNIVPKGSMTIDGVSLTVASVEGDEIEVALVPFTLENTIFGTLSPGDSVNIETDIIGRYVAHLLPSRT
ncbi:MAG: riboflavin synthase [Candidatus Peregrinibacteria bacterium]|nr:riboflavin synthase [Candidatus Peregrinibacteria bacterium]